MYSYFYRCTYFFVFVRESGIMGELDFVSRKSRGEERESGGGGSIISEPGPVVVEA